MQKTLSLWNFFTIGFGAIIGTGWVLLVGDWMILGGGPAAAVIAFVLGALFLLPAGAVFGELTSAIPVSGGIVEYVHRSMGKTAAYITGWMLILGNAVLCPWEAIAISTLVSDMFGQLIPGINSIKLYTILGADVYLIPTVIGLAAALFVIRLNFKSAASVAKLQGFLTKALLLGMCLAMIISFIKGNPSNFLPVFSRVEGPGAVSTGAGSLFTGVLSVLVITPFFYAGFDTIPQQAEEASENLDWKKFGRVIGLSLLAAGVFYCVCIYAFGTILPWEEFIKSEVPALACLKTIGMYFYLPMLVIATLGPLGPMNSFYAASARIMLAMGRKELLPGSFASIDKKSGTPKTANIILAVLTLAGPFLGKNMLLPLTSVSSLAFVFACTMVSIACLRMRSTEPELVRPYRVPFGRAGIWASILCGGAIIGLLVVPASPAALSGVEWVVAAGWLAAGLIIFSVYKRRRV